MPAGEPLFFSRDGEKLVTREDERTIRVWDLRRIRRRLARMRLDWDTPPFGSRRPAPPLSIRVSKGTLIASPESQADSQRLQAQVELYTLLAELSPFHPEPYHYRGHLHYALGRYEKAVGDFTAALRRQPRHMLRTSHLLESRAQAYLALRRFDRAVEDFRQALEINLTRTEVYQSLAWLHGVGPSTVRDADKALALAREAVRLAPDAYVSLNVLGIAQYRKGQ